MVLIRSIILAAVFMLLSGVQLELPGTPTFDQDQEQVVYLPGVFRNYVPGFTEPGFENGGQAWEVQSNQGDGVVTNAAAHSGSYSAALGDGSGSRTASISQEISIPEQAYAVQYYQWARSLQACPGMNRLMVYVNGQPYQHYSICQGDENSTWVPVNLYLAPYKGQRVDFRLEFESSNTNGDILYVDDFSFGVP